MLVLDLINPLIIKEIGPGNFSHRLLPDDCVILNNTPFIRPEISWDDFYQQLRQIQAQGLSQRYVFVDCSYDPIKYSDSEIQQRINEIAEFFPANKTAFLSSLTRHYFSNLSKVIYYPFFFLPKYEEYQPRPRSHRIGCLNRQNTPHRPWLMHNLLSQGLIDDRRDVFSISFTSVYDDVSYSDVASWLGKPPEFNNILRQWPSKMATHSDNFYNDWTTHHPAWHTAISVITETDPGTHTLITEKTIKGIMSQSCWTSYMDDSGYKLLEAFGFEPRLFADHASYTNIEPILGICRTFDTESAAMDYYHSLQHIIQHNFHWYGGTSGSTRQLGPWIDRFLPKFHSLLENL